MEKFELLDCNVLEFEEEIIGKVEDIYKLFRNRIVLAALDMGLSAEEMTSNIDECTNLLQDLEDIVNDDCMIVVKYHTMGGYYFRKLFEVEYE